MYDVWNDIGVFVTPETPEDTNHAVEKTEDLSMIYVIEAMEKSELLLREIKSFVEKVAYPQVDLQRQSTRKLRKPVEDQV